MLPPVEPPLVDPPVPEYVTVTVSTPALPRASNAVTVMTFVPFCSGMPDALQFDEPLAVYDELLVGDVMVATVRVVSPLPPVPPPPVEEFMVQVNCCEAVSVPSLARAVTLYVPALVPVPEIYPVLACTESPVGNPVAL